MDATDVILRFTDSNAVGGVDVSKDYFDNQVKFRSQTFNAISVYNSYSNALFHFIDADLNDKYYAAFNLMSRRKKNCLEAFISVMNAR